SGLTDVRGPRRPRRKRELLFLFDGEERLPDVDAGRGGRLREADRQGGAGESAQRLARVLRCGVRVDDECELRRSGDDAGDRADEGDTDAARVGADVQYDAQ